MGMGVQPGGVGGGMGGGVSGVQPGMSSTGLGGGVTGGAGVWKRQVRHCKMSLMSAHRRVLLILFSQMFSNIHLGRALVSWLYSTSTSTKIQCTVEKILKAYIL